jgi:hypothetical protein
MTDNKSAEQVALELTKMIAEKDMSALKIKMEDPKKYFLSLFRECLAAVQGK